MIAVVVKGDGAARGLRLVEVFGVSAVRLADMGNHEKAEQVEFAKRVAVRAMTIVKNCMFPVV